MRNIFLEKSYTKCGGETSPEPWLPLLCEISGNMCIAIVCEPGCHVINFEVNLIFLIKPLFLHDQKVVTKT